MTKALSLNWKVLLQSGVALLSSCCRLNSKGKFFTVRLVGQSLIAENFGILSSFFVFIFNFKLFDSVSPLCLLCPPSPWGLPIGEGGTAAKVRICIQELLAMSWEKP